MAKTDAKVSFIIFTPVWVPVKSYNIDVIATLSSSSISNSDNDKEYLAWDIELGIIHPTGTLNAVWRGQDPAWHCLYSSCVVLVQM